VRLISTGLLAVAVWALFYGHWVIACMLFAVSIAIRCVNAWYYPLLHWIQGGPSMAHLAALQQASNELRHLPQGPETFQKVKQRADEIMRSEGWKPKGE
jgi:hypothetical protein